MGRFETQGLRADAHLAALADLSGAWIGQVHDRNSPKSIVLNMYSSVCLTHSDQEGTAYNRHFGCIYPLLEFNQFGDLERCIVRAGNAHGADGRREVLDPLVMRYRGRKPRR